jgi:small ligand-binding sensory domain FIST
MNLFTSDKFASVAESGTNWRDISKKVLEQFESIRVSKDDFNFGFLYVTDDLVEDIESILSLFKSVTGIKDWVGSVGLGVCGTGREFADQPAISAMIGRFDKDSYQIFPAIDIDLTEARNELDTWLSHNETMLTLVHGDPNSDPEPSHILGAIESLTGGFLAGGLSSSRSSHVQIARQIMSGGVSGVCFSQDIPVVSFLTQGCTPLGKMHTITRCEGHILQELDGRRAFDVFADDLKALALEQTGKEPEKIFTQDVDEADENDDDSSFRGEVHVAFPVSGSDQEDYLVRNVVGIDPQKGWLALAQEMGNGERLMFVHRDSGTVKAELTRALLDVRNRVKKDHGVFNPKGAIYISCAARSLSEFGLSPGGEADLVREILGEIPLAGYYANGEISNHRLYGYAAVLVLFI